MRLLNYEKYHVIFVQLGLRVMTYMRSQTKIFICLPSLITLMSDEKYHI